MVRARTLKLTIAYDGTRYAVWQVQSSRQQSAQGQGKTKTDDSGDARVGAEQDSAGARDGDWEWADRCRRPCHRPSGACADAERVPARAVVAVDQRAVAAGPGGASD